MLIDLQPAIVQTILQKGGMPSDLCDQCHIHPVSEGGLAVTFKIESPSGVFYLKLHEAEGARGGPFLKHLLPIGDPQMREHAEKRRHFVRKMLDSVITQRSTLVPQPCYFDLQPYPMALQKLRKETEQVRAEIRLDGEIYPSRIAGMVGTLWKEMDIEHIPTSSPDKKDVWNPIDYSPENVFLCTAAIGEFQQKSEKFLEAAIQRKVQAGKGTSDQIREKLSRKLQHEQRALMGYETLTTDLFPPQQSKSNPFEIKELQAQFLADVLIPPEHAKLPFQKLMFIAERERWWSPSKRDEGKALDRLEQSETIAKEWLNNPNRFTPLIQEIQNFKEIYQRIEKLPQSIVPQDAHPFNFFIHQEDQAVAMLDLEDLSMGVRFADLSTVYVYKILRAVIQEKITESQAIEYLRAVIDGYNSTASTPLTSEELELMADYSIAVFLNFLPQFNNICRQDPNELNAYNLAMSADAFIQQFQLLKQISELWKNILPNL